MSIERFKFRGKATRDWLVTGDEKTPQKGDWITTETMRHSQFFEMVEVGSIDPTTVGQWTGLVDSKGVEIYEGDILSVTDPNDERVEDCIVEFKNAWSCYPIEVSMDDFDVTTLGWAKDFGFVLTVIGSIHDKAAV